MLVPNVQCIAAMPRSTIETLSEVELARVCGGEGPEFPLTVGRRLWQRRGGPGVSVDWHPALGHFFDLGYGLKPKDVIDEGPSGGWGIG